MDASQWPSRRYFLARRRIIQVSTEVVESPKPNLKTLTRAELNEYATFLGIEDAEDFPNKESLIERIQELEPEEPVSDDETEVIGLEEEDSEEEELEEALNPEDDESDETDDSEEDDDSDDSGDEDSDDSDSTEVIVAGDPE